MKKIDILLSAALLAFGCQQGTTDSINVIPYPNEVEVKGGTFNAAGAGFCYASEFDQAAKDAINSFASQLSLVTGAESLASEGTASKGFVFRYNAELPAEAYTLSVSRKAAVAEASSLSHTVIACGGGAVLAEENISSTASQAASDTAFLSSTTAAAVQTLNSADAFSDRDLSGDWDESTAETITLNGSTASSTSIRKKMASPRKNRRVR